MTILSAFADFVATTGPSILTGPEDIVNDATKNSWTLPHFIDGKSMSEMVQGGTQVQDVIMFEANARFENYSPNPSFTYANPQNAVTWAVPWRFSRGEMVWTDHEILLNTGNLSAGARHHQFKRLKHLKEMNTWTSFITGIDNQFWAQPQTTLMESSAADPGAPYSIPVTVHEFGPDHLGTAANSATPGVFGGATTNPDLTAWTTVQGINPATEAQWDNFRISYNGAAAVASATQHLFQSFTVAWHKVKFNQLPRRPDLTDPVTMPNVIFCSILGISVYEAACQANQDTFVSAGRQNPAYAYLNYRGTPLQYISDLDTAALYPTGSAASPELAVLSTEQDDTNSATPQFHAAGPRYYMTDGRYYLKVFHNERYFYKTKVFQPSAQPFTNVMVIDTWHQNTCRSRRRQALIFPSADIAGL